MHGAAQQTRLGGFGYRFLGPFLVDWYNRLTSRLTGADDGLVHLLGREGWSLVPFFNTLEAIRGGDRRYLYLQGSRALLTHIALATPAVADFAFTSNFNGTVRRFVEARLGLPFALLGAGAASDEIVSLPRDRDYLRGLLAPFYYRAVATAERSRAAYRRYLERTHFLRAGDALLGDLGFRGTTQALLGAVFEQPIRGFYALLDPSGVPAPLTLAQGTTTGLFSESHSFGSGYAPLDRSLLLEVMLTAPAGQVIGIEDRSHGDPFIYRQGGAAQRNYGIIAEIVQGAYRFSLDHTDLIGSAEPLIEDFAAFFDSYQTAVVNELEILEDIMEIDDSYFGIDIINAKIKL